MKICFAGDLYLRNPDEIKISDEVQKILDESDFNILNFEAPISSLDYSERVIKSGPKLMQPPIIVDWLKCAKFGMLAFANNHIMDYGIEGYLKTKNILNGFDIIGCGSWNESYKLKILQKDGLKVGIINVSELQFGVLHDSWTIKDGEKGCGWINHPCINSKVMEFKNQVDYLIIFAHAGLEMVDFPLPEWRERYRELIDLGCDLIVAAHPHVPQGYEMYNEKPIFYSLGNFCFSPIDNFISPKWNIGELLCLDISKEKLSFQLKGVQIQGAELNFISKQIWEQEITSLNNMLAIKNYMLLVDEMCKFKLNEYWELFNMGGLFHVDKKWLKSIARIILGKYNLVHLINNLQCESHRWCIIRALKLLNK